MCTCAANVVSLVFHTKCGAFKTDLSVTSFPSYACPHATTIVSHADFFFSKTWFNPSEVQSFPAIGHADGNGLFRAPPPLGHILYLELQRWGAFSVDDLVRVRGRWAKGGWEPWTDSSSLRLRLVELVMIKLELMNGPRWRILPF